MLDKLDGKKTYIGALILAIAGANQVLHVFPVAYSGAVVTFGLAVATYGLRDALRKLQEGGFRGSQQ